MRTIMVKGFSKTGKTTTVTALVRELQSRGYTVGTIKDIHYDGFMADRPGTDTYKQAEAGARRVTARGQAQTAIINSRQMTVHEILKYYKEDFVIIEGDCGLKCPMIITGKTPEDINARMSPEAVAVSGIVATQLIEEGQRGFEVQTSFAKGRKILPIIDGVAEVKKLADLVEKVTKNMEEKPEVELKIDGEEIWMVPFVKETIKNVVVGAVKALDGYEEGKEIIIKIK